jgi:hypothetical protein
MNLHPTIEDLIAEIETFREKTGMTVTAFGLSAAGDPNFIKDAKAGRKLNLWLIDRVRAFMQSQSETAA